MDLDDFMSAVCGVVDEAVPRVREGRRQRQRGPAPRLADSAVVALEVVGDYLGREQDSARFAAFRRHDAPFFRARRPLHRTSLVRPAATRWWLTQQLWQPVWARIPQDPAFAIRARRLLPVGPCARAARGPRCRGAAAGGKDTLVRQTVYGLRLQGRREGPGVITRVGLTPANTHELRALPALAEQTGGLLGGRRNDWSPPTTAQWQRHGVQLLAPYRRANRDPPPRGSTVLSRVRYRIDTVFGQLVDRGDGPRIWARGQWHLGRRRLRKLLMHTVAILLTGELGNPPLQLAQVVAYNTLHIGLGRRKRR